MSPRPSPVSRRPRPAKPPLSRSGIVAVAVDLLRTEGFERVTMRRLAQELDTGAASLYVYVRDTMELHAAVLDELLAEIDLGVDGTDDAPDDAPVDAPDDAPVDPTAGLRAVVSSYVQILYAYPGLARVALTGRLSSPHYLALVERLLFLLAAAGLPGDRAAWLLDVVLLVATASAVEHGTRSGTLAAASEDGALLAALEQAPAERYPHIAALGVAELMSGPGPARLGWFLDVLVNGGRTTPRPATPAATPDPQETP